MKKPFLSSIETNFEFTSSPWILAILRLLPTFINKKFIYQVTYKYVRNEIVGLNIINLLTLKSIFYAEFSSVQFDKIRNSNELENSLENFAENWLKQMKPIMHSLYEEKNILFLSTGQK